MRAYLRSLISPFNRRFSLQQKPEPWQLTFYTWDVREIKSTPFYPKLFNRRRKIFFRWMLFKFIFFALVKVEAVFLVNNTN